VLKAVAGALRILLWNVEWASPRSQRGRRIRSRVAELAPDVVCLTEATAAMLPEDGFVLDAHADYGYGATGDRRKVLLWSRSPWTAVDRVGNETMPGGRYASGVTLGTRFVGICVPWRDAHVRTGRRDREPWEDHRRYLDALHGVVQTYAAAPEPLVVLGDLNQRVPRYRQPPDVYAALQRVLWEGLACPTADDADWVHAQIDHLLVGAGVEVLDVVALPRVDPDGLRVSDHDGLVVRLTISP
jgi:endonuclease/exonuclease/phosphatase family metal-dependent hydrolase